jgi:cell wall-associated NlpC family hydrolase
MQNLFALHDSCRSALAEAFYAAKRNVGTFSKERRVGKATCAHAEPFGTRESKFDRPATWARVALPTLQKLVLLIDARKLSLGLVLVSSALITGCASRSATAPATKTASANVQVSPPKLPPPTATAALSPATRATPDDEIGRVLKEKEREEQRTRDGERGGEVNQSPPTFPLPDNPIQEAPWQRVLFTAMSLHGRLYQFGGNGLNGGGFDCSGFVRHVFMQAAELTLPRSAAEQAQQGTDVDATGLQPGDLVFYNTLRRPYSHVGIYIGEGRFIHSPSKGKSVEIVEMNERYWSGRFNGARRIL